MTTTKTYDKLNRLTGMISTPSGGGQLPFSYGASYNEANQRITVTMNDGSYWIYEYDTLGQISSAKKHFADGAFVPGQQFTYSYDQIGNRSTTRAGGDQNGSLSGDGYAYYTDSFLNQYTTRYRPYPVHVTGAADPDETVYVNGAQVAYRNGEYFWKELSYVSTLATWFKIEVATSGCETNSGSIFIPSRPEYFTYDLDGNMVSSSRWNYTWDAENRLTSMTDNTTCTNDVPKRIVFEYDYLGRRIAKKVWNNTAGTGTPATYLKYLYDGWNLIAELDGNNALVRSYTWGLDASGSMQGAGGVGGLLMVNAGSGGVHFPAYDLNGNVMGLVNAANGNISAKYEYGPFGEVFCSVGDMAKVNPFQFSTKYTDNETDLVYYGYRYYSPALGRWLSRDPIEEQGGLNLYGFVNNDPVNAHDMLGLWGTDIHYTATKVWATNLGYPESAAGTIAANDAGVDGGYLGIIRGGKGPLPIIGDQSYHFNRNLKGGMDSRIEHHLDHLAEAKFDCTYPLDYPLDAAVELGISLHPLQDWVAHGDYGIRDYFGIFKIHNSQSPQTEFGSPSDYPDNPELDAVDGPSGRPAGKAMIYDSVKAYKIVNPGGAKMLVSESREWAKYKLGNRRINQTKKETDSTLKDFQRHVKKYGGICCKKFFGVNN